MIDKVFRAMSPPVGSMGAGDGLFPEVPTPRGDRLRGPEAQKRRPEGPVVEIRQPLLPSRGGVFVIQRQGQQQAT